MVSMINKTRIFISSAFETDLKEPRKMVKKHLEESGHEVPIFESGDFGSWENDTLDQCLSVVRSSDVFVLLINKKSGASSKLMKGNVTPTYLEYKTALNEKKHILVFVSPEVKKNFQQIHSELKRLHEGYKEVNHRAPDSPFDPLEKWIEDGQKNEGLTKQLLEVADPFVWAFLYEIYNNQHWLYEFDISKSEEQAKNISAMLSTSLRSVVGLISERKQIQKLKDQATYLLNYADYTLDMFNEKNSIISRVVDAVENKDLWSNFLTKGIKFLQKPTEIIQAPDFNPTVVNTINGCFAASLYYYNEEINVLTLVGTTGEITAEEEFSLNQEDVFVVDAFKNEDRISVYVENKQTIYITEPIGDYVLCLHFSLDEKMTTAAVTAYIKEIESSIFDKHEYYFGFLKLLIGGRS